jgi:hypothetical protein
VIDSFMLAWSLGLAQFWAFWYSPRDYANFFFHNSRDATAEPPHT